MVYARRRRTLAGLALGAALVGSTLTPTVPAHAGAIAAGAVPAAGGGSLTRLALALSPTDLAKPGRWFSSGGLMSGNGRYVAYDYLRKLEVEPWTTDSRAVVRDLTTGEDRVLTGPDGEGSWRPLALADDGQTLLIRARRQLVVADTNNRDDLYLWNSVTDARTAVTAGLPRVVHYESLIAADASLRHIAYSAGDPDDGADGYKSCSVYLHDAVSGTTTPVPSTPDGQSCGNTLRMSGDGQTLVFGSSFAGGNGWMYVWSVSSGLERIDDEYSISVGGLSPSGDAIVFSRSNALVRLDRSTGTRTSVATVSYDQNYGSYPAPVSVSDDLRWAMFSSDDRKFVHADTDSNTDTFLLDTATGQVERINTTSDGQPVAGNTWPARLSADGTVAIFQTNAALVPNDNNSYLDVYVRTFGQHRGPPEVTFDASTVPGAATGARPTAAFTSAHPDARFECRADSGTWQTCTSPHTFGPLTDGSHTLAVRAVTVGGLLGSQTTTTVTVDTTAPETTLVTAPPALTRSRVVTLGFTSPDPAARFECRVRAQPWQGCVSPWSAALTSGLSTLEVRAVDVIGNADPTPLTRAVTVDSQAPASRIASGPPKSSRDRTPTFRFSSDEPASTFSCRMDGGSWRACPTTWTSSKLKPGKHTLSVRATDRAGNVDPTPAARTFRVVR